MSKTKSAGHLVPSKSDKTFFYYLDTDTPPINIVRSKTGGFYTKPSLEKLVSDSVISHTQKDNIVRELESSTLINDFVVGYRPSVCIDKHLDTVRRNQIKERISAFGDQIQKDAGAIDRSLYEKFLKEIEDGLDTLSMD